FVQDPFSPDSSAPMYRTGDVGRYLASGELEYQGRRDHQVKVRGFRIELGEIESLLAGARGVRAAIVLVREDTPGDKRIVAYYVGEAAPSSLRAELTATLPSYMVPSAFVKRDALPLTPNGKVDRAALPAPSIALEGDGEGAPRTETEAALAAIFAE